MDQTRLLGKLTRWTATMTTASSEVATAGITLFSDKGVSPSLLNLLLTASHENLSAPSHSGSCPYHCPKTVTLCGQCIYYNVPGNIHYGYVSCAASIRHWLLLFAANTVQKASGIDDTRDPNAIRIGMGRWDDPRKRANFYRDVLSRIGSLILD